MKRIITIILASLMLLSLVACGNNVAEETTEKLPVHNKVPVNNNDSNSGAIISPSVPETSWGYAFWNVFHDSIKNNSKISTNEIVQNILASDAGKAIGFSENADMPEGYLPGFSEDIKGFKSATMFTPAASGYAFMGYVFELENVSKVDNFIKTLNEKCDLRWMICMTAEMTTVGAYDNYVLFVMSPTNMP